MAGECFGVANAAVPLGAVPVKGYAGLGPWLMAGLPVPYLDRLHYGEVAGSGWV